MRILTKIGVNAAALWIATLVIPGIGITRTRFGSEVATFLVFGAIFGAVNTFIRPIAQLFAFPLNVLTLGLFTFVVNALMIRLMGWLAEPLGFAFNSGPFFWSTLGAAVVTTVVSMLLYALMPGSRDD